MDVCALHDAGMMGSSQKQRLKHLLIDTIQVLCKNSLPDESLFCIEATIGITLSSDHVMVISFKERIKSDGSHLSLMMDDEQDHECEQQSGKSVNETKKQQNMSHSSQSRGDSDIEHSFKENSTGRQHAEILQTHSNNSVTDGVFVNSVDNSMMPSHIASFGDTEVSAMNHRSVPISDNCHTVTQTSVDHDNDSEDDVVIFKVEEGNDNVHTVSGVHQFGNQVTAPPGQSCSKVRKRKRSRVLPRERFDGGLVHGHLCQTSSSVETNNLLYTVESDQQAAPLNAS